MGKTILNVIVVLVVLVVLTLVWHNVAFGSQYPDHLKGIVATDDAGNPAPRMLYFIAAHIVAAIAFVWYLPLAAKSRGQYVEHGAVMGLITFGFFALLSHGLFQNWTTWLMGMDIGFGVLGGAITGLVVSYLPKSATT
jgi:uncharacterized membrane protein